MKSFADVLTEQLRCHGKKTFTGTFLSVLILAVVCYFALTFVAIDREAAEILRTTMLETNFLGSVSSELVKDVKNFCASVNCERVMIVNNSSNQVAFSYPDESAIGATVVLPSIPSDGVGLKISLRVAQVKWTETGATLMLEFNFWKPLYTIGFMAIFFGTTAVGFFWAAQRSGKEVSKILAKELAVLTADAEANFQSCSSFLTIEGQTIHQIILKYRERLLLFSKIEAENHRSHELANLATQIAHDIRSPLTALAVLVSNTSTLEMSRKILLKSTFDRINGIADDLLKQSRGIVRNLNQARLIPISDLLANVVIEKQIQIESENIFVKSNIEKDLMAFCSANEFSQIISNLVNNGLEAITGAGGVQVIASAAGDTVCVCIRDNGCGISSELIPRLMVKGATFGKSEGNGLGLFYAKSTIESWCGRIVIESELGKGTSVYINLKC